MRKVLKGCVNALFLVLAFVPALLTGFGRVKPVYTFFAQSFATAPGGVGDYLRDFLGQITPNHSPAHMYVNRGKRSVTLDLRSDEGREVFFQLLRDADIFVDGFAGLRSIEARCRLAGMFGAFRAVSPEFALSAESEGVGLHARIEKADLERMIGNRLRCADELIEPLRRDYANAFGIGVHAVSIAGRLAVDGDAEADLAAFDRGTEDEVQVTRMEAVDDAAVLRVQLRTLFADRPFPDQ